MEIHIPTEVFWVLIVLVGAIVYSVIGAAIAGIDKRFDNALRCKFFLFEDDDDACVVVFWPIYLTIFVSCLIFSLVFILMWWTVCLPARIVFEKLSGKKG